MAAEGDKKRFLNVLQLMQTQVAEKHMESFAALKSDEDRIRYLLEDGRVYDIVKVDTPLKEKTQEAAEKYRSEGNKAFQGKHYRQSQQLYTQSVFYSPEDSTCLALAYANRSAALFHMQRYPECIVDVGRALEQGYPEESRYKLYDRRAKCYAATGQNEPALHDFDKALEHLKVAKLNEKQLEKWRDDITKGRDKAAENKGAKWKDAQKELEIAKDEADALKSYLTGKQDVCPKPEWEETYTVRRMKPSRRLEGTSACLGVRWNAERGRHVVALEPVAVGETLMMEAAYASVLHSRCWSTHCHHCCQRSLVLVPSPLSPLVGFCSRACLDAALPYHRVEHAHLLLLHQKGMERLGFLALRSALVAGLDQLMAARLGDVDERNIPGQTDGGQRHLKSILNLTSNNDKRQPPNLLQFALMALYLLRVVESGGLFGADGATHQDRVQAGTVLLRLIQIVQCNAYSITETKVLSDFRLCQPTDVGLGLYPTMAMMNHSCNPRAEPVFLAGNHCLVRAVRGVPAGQEVTIDYGPVYYVQRKADRQTRLQYQFDCSCEACRGDWGLVDELPSEMPSFKCKVCGHPHPPMETTSMMAAVTCLRCGTKMDIVKTMRKLCKSHEAFSRAMERIVAGSLRSCVPVLLKHLTLMDKYLCLPWRDFASCQATLKQCYRLSGNKNYQE